ncbi:hemicentin-2 [Schistocerca serialis cubense]|uniref:hemicentin-2 n=1 Tax=Schistocerca serialis cubense TaxID=2023355 RepID=UPI00214E1085|nr:hemicentin-2 [Schistocerca serialis cubense]
MSRRPPRCCLLRLCCCGWRRWRLPVSERREAGVAEEGRRGRRGGTGLPAATGVADAACALLLFLLVAVVQSATSDDVQDFQKILPAEVVWAVSGEDAELPCNITPPYPDDRVNMVLWFKDSSVPLYSLDARGSSLEEAVHSATTDDLGARANFQALSRLPGRRAVLRVQNVSVADEGVFRCRIDFRNSPTVNFRINLTIVVPPSPPAIFDSNDREVSAIAGPFLEGYDLFLACKVHGGRPRPEVTWWQGGLLRDASIDLVTDAVTVNRWFVSSVPRSLWNSHVECRATSSSLMRPLVKRVHLDVYLKPQGVRLTSQEMLLSAGKPYTMQCETWGSVPPARVTWMLDGEQLRSPQMQVEHLGNVTVSRLVLRPRVHDQQKELACRVENPYFPGGILEDRRRLFIAYAPAVSVRLDSDTGQTIFKEGDNVRLACEVNSNPQPDTVSWFHEDRLLRNDSSFSVVTSLRTLLLLGVTRASNGDYSCAAANSEGETRSAPLRLRVQYAPRCRPGHEEARVGAVRHEAVSALCEVDADPGGEAVRFSWTLQRGRDVLPLPASRAAARGAASELRYTPAAETDFGTLACWASNSVGRQDRPCLFHIVHGRTPQPPEQCSVRNDSAGVSFGAGSRMAVVRGGEAPAASLEVWCSPGDDGDLAQHFVLEVRPLDESGESRVTEPGAMSDQAAPGGAPLQLVRGASPRFTVSGLRPGRYQLAVFAENRLGRSHPPVLLSSVAAAEGTQPLAGDAQ